MKVLLVGFVYFFLINPCIVFAQTIAKDSTKKSILALKEIVISVNKEEESKRFIAQQIQLLDARQIKNAQAQSTADLIANTGSVFIQKSQMGGGSATIRGFEANSILLVIDGVRLNNLIYRSGHLQNLITTDNNSMERVEILFGPASTVYGSDALGGVIHLFTKKPLLALDSNKLIRANYLARYGSVNNEITNHVDFNFGTQKWAFYTSFTYSKFGDFKSGKSKNFFFNKIYGTRPLFVNTINDIDSIIKNDNIYLQRETKYSQYDLLQKVIFKQSKYVNHAINIQFSNSSDISRYDRLTDTINKKLRFAQWYYGPQKRLLTAYDFNYNKETIFFQSIHFGANYQYIQESRNTRVFRKKDLQQRIEDVNVVGFNLDMQHKSVNHKLRVGIDGQYNTLASTATTINILNNIQTGLDTRYPDGKNSMFNTSMYVSHTWLFNEKITFVDGGRIGWSSLKSTFIDTSFFKFPFDNINQINKVISGSIGIIYSPNQKNKISLLSSTGYRVPNVDDIGKVFDSRPGTIIIPNDKIKPEKTWSNELSHSLGLTENIYFENVIYYTFLFDAIITDKFKFEGNDSIIYQGVKSGVLANQNKQRAYIYGFSNSLKAYISNSLLLTFNYNYTYGRIKSGDVEIPLDHIPLALVRLSIKYTNNKISSEFFLNYNSWKRIKDYGLNGEDNQQYTVKEGAPAWLTANIRFAYQFNKYCSLQAGVDNILDTQYRTFASGINAPGRNVFLTFKLSL